MNDVGPIPLYSLRLELVDLAAVHSLQWISPCGLLTF
jgi:hypothetical protein